MCQRRSHTSFPFRQSLKLIFFQTTGTLVENRLLPAAVSLHKPDTKKLTPTRGFSPPSSLAWLIRLIAHGLGPHSPPFQKFTYPALQRHIQQRRLKLPRQHQRHWQPHSIYTRISTSTADSSSICTSSWYIHSLAPTSCMVLAFSSSRLGTQ